MILFSRFIDLKDLTVYIKVNLFISWFFLLHFCFFLFFLLAFLLSNTLNISFRNIVDELASHSIWAVPIGSKLFAWLSLVEDGYISFDHHLGFFMSK